MKAITQNMGYEFSKARKVVASVVAAAMIVSFGNFALGSPSKALAEDGTVEVRFQVADGMTVAVGADRFASDMDAVYEAPVDTDLTFSVDAPAHTAIEVTYEAEGGDPVSRAMGSKQPSDNLIIGEPSLEDGSQETSPAPSSDEGGEENSAHDGSGPAPSPVAPDAPAADTPVEGDAPNVNEAAHEADSAEVLGDSEAVGSSAAEAVPLAETGENAVEEVLPDEYPPMAAAPASQEDEELVVATTVEPAADGSYTIPLAVLAEAADRGAVVVVSVEPAPGASTWDDVAKALSEGDEGTVKLAANIEEAISPVEVKGTKTLDLNGHTIAVDEIDTLFTVNADATLTITDTNDDAAPVKLNVPGAARGEKIPRPADDRKGFKAMIGKKAEYNADAQTLRYFITSSYANRPAKGETTEYLYQYDLDLSGAGSIKARQAVNLVQVSGGTLNIEGGRLTMEQGDHVVAAQEGTITMTDGCIVGSTGADGAAINAKKATVEITDQAIIAGNTARGDGNGGALWVDNTQLTVAGDALIAGNRAGEEVFNDTTPGGMAQVRNGGGIYANASSTVTLADNAVLAGNTAQADGGAVYVQGRLRNNGSQAKSVLTVKDSALVTNNRSENDKSAIHPSVRPDTNEGVNWKQLGGGGGGIFSMDETVIAGASLTGNYASDGGGGLLMASYALYSGTTRIDQYIYPLLKVESGVFASNYAGTSEGGAINAMPDKASYIKSGYITNNMTATEFDYGGGGLFLPSATHGKETGLTVRYPVVTGNTARGFGGGVGVCTNGVVVTADAAIFDNTAKQANATTNPNEYGDQWALDPTYGLKIDPHAADDFFCAKESTVFNAMLGGGYHRWTGYTSGTVSYIPDMTYKGTLSATRTGGWANKAVSMIIDGKDLTSSGIPNVIMKNKAEGIVEIYVPDAHAGSDGFLEGYYATVKVATGNSSADGTVAGEVTACKKVESDSPGFKKYELTIDQSAPAPDQRQEVPFDDKPQTLVAETRTDEKKEYPVYHLTNPNTFPQTAEAVLQADRFTALKADPTPADKEAAMGMAVLYFTGNYSNTNGGAIACNDRIVVGRDPEVPGKPEVPGNPDEPEKRGALQLVKNLNNFEAANGVATAVFQVTGYVDQAAAANKVDDLVIYQNTVSMTFGAGKDQTKAELLTDLPEGYYLIEEIYYSGDNFGDTPNREIVAVEGAVPGEEADIPVTEVTFDNTYEDEGYGTGVVNRYAPGENGFTYTPMPTTEEGR